MKPFAPTTFSLFLAGLLSVSAQAPAAAETDSGSINCTGDGHIVPRIAYATAVGHEVSVKQAGPPSSPTWGNSIGPGSGVDSMAVDSYWSPYAEGTWTAYSGSSAMSASAACSKRAAPSGTPVRTVSLGDKSCGSGHVAIDADGFANIWISWKKSPTGQRHRAYFPKDPYGFIVFNRIYTRDAAVFDIKIHAYNSDAKTPLQGYGDLCTSRGSGSVS